MFFILNRLSVRNRIWMIVAVLIGSSILGAAIDILRLRAALWQEREVQTRQLVETGFGVLRYWHEQQQRGVLTEAAAQAAAIGSIKAMRYDDKEYFWLNDLGTPFPRMIMHPLAPALDGQVLDDAAFNNTTGLRLGTAGAFTPTRDQANLFQTISQILQQDDAGYVTYTWPKPGNDGSLSQERYAKLSYVKKFAPWGWAIGSGLYLDDVEAAVQQQAGRNLALVAGVGIVVLLFATLMARSITRPLQRTVATMRTIGENAGNLRLRLPLEGHSEISELATGFNDMLEHLAARDEELASHRQHLEAEVARRTGELRESNALLSRELAEHQQAEQALKDSEERFGSICATAQDAIIMLDSDANIAYWNPAAETVFGYRREEALGRGLHQLIAPPRYHAAFQRGFAQFQRTGQGAAVGKTVELVGLRQDGSEFPMELSISAMHLQGNWAAVGFVRDISARKHSEQSLRENRSRMRALLDATTESVLLLEPAGKILAINAFAAERFGQTPEALTGTDFFALLPPTLAASRRATMEHVAASGEPMQTQDRRGTTFFDNSLYPVKDDSGAVESIAVYAKDVSEQHRSKEVDNIFRHLDTVLLRWQMDQEAIAQIFCDDLLPVFDLAAAWIGRAEEDGRLTLLAGAEGATAGFLDPLRENGLRWDDEAIDCRLPIGAVIRDGQRQIVSLGELHCPSCDQVAAASGAQVACLLPLALRDKTWGILALYGREAGQFEGPQLSIRLGTLANRLGTSLEAAAQQEWLTLLDTALATVGNAVFITDAKANIRWANRSFTELSGYASEEILGQTPKLFSSGRQDADFYRQFWQTISSGHSWHGEIVNARRDGSRYTVNQTVTPLLNASDQVCHYIAILEDISERKAVEARIQHSANFDQLTDLPNRGLCYDRLGQALSLARRDGQSGAVLFLDLDRFKEVNDQLGHAAGDQLLIAIAQRLRTQVRESDTVARLGGDEFTVILPSLCKPADAIGVADKILAGLAQPLNIAGQELRIGVSIGIAFFPEHGDSVDQILDAADHAMYLAKKGGRNRYAFVDAATLAAASPRP